MKLQKKHQGLTEENEQINIKFCAESKLKRMQQDFDSLGNRASVLALIYSHILWSPASRKCLISLGCITPKMLCFSLDGQMISCCYLLETVNLQFKLESLAGWKRSGDIPCRFTDGFWTLRRLQNMHALWKNPKPVEEGQFMRRTSELIKRRTSDARWKNVDAFEREKWTMTMEDEVLENLKPVLYRKKSLRLFWRVFWSFWSQLPRAMQFQKLFVSIHVKSKTPARKDAHIPLLPFENMIYDTNHKDHSAVQRETCNLCS